MFRIWQINQKLHKQIWLMVVTHLFIWLSCSGIVGFGIYVYQGSDFTKSCLIVSVYFLLLGFGNSFMGELLDGVNYRERFAKPWQGIMNILPHLIITVSGALIGDVIRRWIVESQIYTGREFWIVLGYLLLVGILLIGLLIGIWYEHQRRITLESSLIQAELIALKAQIKPHFLFNTLNTIISMIRENPVQAEKVTQQFAELMRYILMASEYETIPLEQELECVEQYLGIEKERFKGKLNYTIEVKEQWFSFLLPPLILQPLIENSVRHGIIPKLAPGHIEITITPYKNGEALVVSDNGVGFNTDHLKKPLAPNGHGLQNVSQRWKKFMGMAIEIESTLEEGTCIYLPFKQRVTNILP